MDVKAGYKQTKVGVIPEDWNVCHLSSLVSSGPKNGWSGRSGKDARGTPTLSLTATSSGRIVLDEETVKHLEITLDQNSDVFLRAGDVLVQRSNTSELVGTTAIFDGPSGVYAYPDLMMRLRFKAQEAAHWFWRYANSSRGRRYFISAAAGSTGTMPKISGDKLRNMPLPLPDSAEQRAIATVFSDVDALLGALERLITKKRDLKQAAMQRLLTGKTRLPGFSGEWESRRLGEIVQVRKTRMDPRVSNPGKFCVELEHIEQGTGCLLGHTSTVVGMSLKSVFEKDDVLFGKLRAYLRKYWLATRDGLCSTEVWVLVADPFLLIPRLLLQIVSTDQFIEAASSAYGTHMPRTDWNVVKNYETQLPSTEEQIAIAAVLTDMDAELAVLEQRLAKTRNIKQAMMQELLTGKTRLVSPHDAHA
jgi:type I restriction enzyme S subunit